MTALTVIGSIVLAVSVSVVVLPKIAESAQRGKLLRESAPAAPGFEVDRYGGAYYPDLARAHRVLAASGERGYYSPPKETVHPWRMVTEASPPKWSRAYGHIDAVQLQGSRVSVQGWTDIRPSQSERIMRLYTPRAVRSAKPVAVLARQDVAFALDDRRQLFSGFRVELDYEDSAAAEEAAARLCIVAEAPGVEPALLIGSSPVCAAR